MLTNLYKLKFRINFIFANPLVKNEREKLIRIFFDRIRRKAKMNTITIWVEANGSLFIFKDVPIDDDDDICSNWWEANVTDNIVCESQDNCLWGELSGSIKEIETPAEGWKLED